MTIEEAFEKEKITRAHEWRMKHPWIMILDSLIDWLFFAGCIFLMAQCSCNGCIKITY